MPVKKSGLVLMNPVTSARENYPSSQRGSTELIHSVPGGIEFSNVNHLRTLREERRDGQKYQEVANKTKLKGLVQYIKGTDRCLILRSRNTGDWLSVRDTAVSGTVLSAM